MKNFKKPQICENEFEAFCYLLIEMLYYNNYDLIIEKSGISPHS